jgi:hypothetical protein
MDTDSLTRERAYLLWQQAGCPAGRSEEFWHAAVASLVATAPAEPAAPAKKAPPRRAAAPSQGGAKKKPMTSIKPPPAGAPIMPA